MTTDPERFGFSEEALRGLEDLERRLPPPAACRPALPSAPPGATGDRRPHYWGHRERLRQRFLAGGHAPCRNTSCWNSCSSTPSRAST
jgi:DNA repair protein RadC